MSIIRFACDYCGHPLEVADDLGGSRKKCPVCNEESEVPILVSRSRHYSVSNTKLWLALTGTVLVGVSLLLTQIPSNAGRQSDAAANATNAETAKLIDQWMIQANRSMLETVSNQPGFQKINRYLCNTHNSDDPSQWSGSVDAEMMTRYGVHKSTNFIIRFLVETAPNGSNTVMSFVDSFAMEKRRVDEQFSLARPHGTNF